MGTFRFAVLLATELMGFLSSFQNSSITGLMEVGNACCRQIDPARFYWKKKTTRPFDGPYMGDLQSPALARTLGRY